MGIFSLKRKPRRFNHVPIFYDERTDRLKAMTDRAKEEMGQKPEQPRTPDDLRGTFTQASSLLQRHRERRGSWTTNIGMLALIILVLLMVWVWILK